jgi:heme/copper-type cytochrome/quinol oxidase subunit 2
LVGNRKMALMVVLAVIVVGVVVSSAYVLYGRKAQSGTGGLPPYCTKPTGGYLIVASARGYNDSVDHGVPASSWPVIDVKKGSTVTITVCNTDAQAHGFQVTHYLDSKIETVSPGQAITVSFVADQTGKFRIYCSIFCTVHWAMQSGLLVVS